MQHSEINITQIQYNILMWWLSIPLTNNNAEITLWKPHWANIIYVNCQPNLTYKEIELQGSVDNETAVGNIFVILTFME